MSGNPDLNQHQQNAQQASADTGFEGLKLAAKQNPVGSEADMRFTTIDIPNFVEQPSAFNSISMKNVVSSMGFPNLSTLSSDSAQSTSTEVNGSLFAVVTGVYEGFKKLVSSSLNLTTQSPEEAASSALREASDSLSERWASRPRDYLNQIAHLATQSIERLRQQGNARKDGSSIEEDGARNSFAKAGGYGVALKIVQGGHNTIEQELIEITHAKLDPSVPVDVVGDEPIT